MTWINIVIRLCMMYNFFVDLSDARRSYYTPIWLDASNAKCIYKQYYRDTEDFKLY